MTDLRPYWSSEQHGLCIYCGDCLEVLPALAEAGERFDLCLTDPPYGVNKAAWDVEFPTEWFEHARAVSRTVGVITDPARLKHSLRLSEEFRDIVALRNLNGMTFGPLGFCNWLACAIFGEVPRLGQTFLCFSVRGTMPEHPSPKPIEAMEKLVERLADEGAALLDPFLGSGTTLVAAYRLGRHATGIEISEEYCELAARRLEQELAQGRLFEPAEVAQPRQEVLSYE